MYIFISVCCLVCKANKKKVIIYPEVILLYNLQKQTVLYLMVNSTIQKLWNITVMPTASLCIVRYILADPKMRKSKQSLCIIFITEICRQASTRINMLKVWKQLKSSYFTRLNLLPSWTTSSLNIWWDCGQYRIKNNHRNMNETTDIN